MSFNLRYCFRVPQENATRYLWVKQILPKVFYLVSGHLSSGENLVFMVLS